MATAAACGFRLDASADNTNFTTIAANSTGGPIGVGPILTLTAQANGYYPYLRIKVLPCTYATTLTYTGYSSAQTINFTSFPLDLTVTSYVTNGYGWLTPTVFQGLTCTNSDSTNTAWLWVVANETTQIATDFPLIFAPIGPNATYTYSGPPIVLLGVTQSILMNYVYFRATTTAAGTTPVTNPVYCNFQSNGSGPYYPFFPYSP